MSEKKTITLQSPIGNLKGVGDKTAALFAAKDIRTVGDLLHFYPRDYDYFTEPVTVDQLKPGEMAAVTLTIIGNGSTVHAGGYQITNFHAADATGQVRLTYFNMPYLMRTIRAGTIHVFRGMVRQYKNGNLQIEQASVYTPAEYTSLKSTFQPRYSLTKGLKNSLIVRLMHKALEECRLPEDYIPEADRAAIGGGAGISADGKHAYSVDLESARGGLTQADPARPDVANSYDHCNSHTERDTGGSADSGDTLMEESEAIQRIHFPRSAQELFRARNRMVFDEFFSFILAVKRQKAEESVIHNDHPMLRVAETARLVEELPYELTDSQKNAWEEIQGDLSGTTVMNRLLQGDVGSGKTILAFLALLMCAANGHQGALMAPTEVLAEQHMRDLSDMVKRYHLDELKPCLLTGSVKGKNRKEVLAAIEDGSANVIIGTHALIQEKVQYKDLCLVVTDEQHRFGVRQREALAGKGAEVPVLVMSATPIPRTLSIILYGDLQVSRLTELPKNRLPIKNLAISSSQRGRVYKFILKQIAEGHQVYVICPAIGEEDEEQEGRGRRELENIGKDGQQDGGYCGSASAAYGGGGYKSYEDIQNVTDYTAKIRQILPESIRIESLNGRMKPAEKDRIMTAFGRHDIDILVSTTVIEVGINVPNATVMLIENAERFGLSQLHQLRGRVGRGQWQSYCVFMYEGNDVPKRLQIISGTNDGFAIAEEDLKMRGPGDLFGVRQSGEMGFRLADIYEDADILTKAAGYADEVLKKDPESTALLYSSLPHIDFRSI